MRFVSLLTSVACVGALTTPTAVWAQGAEPTEEPAVEGAPAEEETAPAETAPAEATPAETPIDTAAAPAEQPQLAPASGTEADATASAGTAAPADTETPAEKEDSSVDGWFRVDHDSLNLQLWVGATHSLGPIDIATDVYVDSGSFGEFDIGPWFEVGLGGDNSLGILPMAGIGFDWAAQKAATLVAPQLFLYLTVGPVYWESWTQTFFNSVFEDGADNDLYLRNFVLFSLSDQVAIGPQVETTLALNNDRDTLASLPVGGRINLSYGKNNTLGLFLGYETNEDARVVEEGTVETSSTFTDINGDDVDVVTGSTPDTAKDRAVVGRITFIRTW